MRYRRYSCSTYYLFAWLPVFLFMGISTNAQLLGTRLTINLGPGSMDKCLLQLEAATKFSFAYEITGLHSLKVPGKSFVNEPLSDILHYLLKGSDYVFKEQHNTIIIGPGTGSAVDMPELQGVIEDKNTGRRLEGVVVYDVDRLSAATVTDKDGYFRLARVPDTLKLRLSYQGHKPVDILLHPRGTPAVCIKIEMDHRAMDTVLVVGPADIGPYSPLSKMSSSTRNPSFLPGFSGNLDLLSLVKITPGILESNDGSGSIIVRGGAPDQNLLLLDDAPIYGDTHLFGLQSSVHAMAVKNIHIYKGAFPARFGGRISSIWDINIKNGNPEQWHGQLSAGTMDAHFLVEGPVLNQKTTLLASGRKSYHDQYLRLFTPGISFYFQDLNIKISHRFSGKDQLCFTAYTSKDHFQLPNELTENSTVTAITKQDILLGSENRAAILKWQHYYSPRFSTQLSLIHSAFNLFTGNQFRTIFPDDPDLWLQRVDKTQNGLNDVSVKLQSKYLVNRCNNWEAGFYHTRHKFHPHTITTQFNTAPALALHYPPYQAEIKIEDKTAFETGFFIEDKWMFSERLDGTAGLHANAYFYGNRSYFSLQPRLNLRYRLSEHIFLQASYVQMQQNLHRLSISQTSLPVDFWIPSTDIIKPQLSDQLSLGFSARLWEGKLDLNVEAYYKAIRNVPEYLVLGTADTANPRPRPSWDQVITTGRGTAYGLEFSVCKSQGSFKSWLSYALSRSTRTLPEVNEGLTFPYKYDRRHSLNLVSTYKLGKSLELSAIFSFQSKPGQPVLIIRSIDKSNNAVELEALAARTELTAYHRLDLGISWVLEYRNGINANLKFSILNVYNRANPFFYFSDNKSNHLSGTSLLPIAPSLSYTLIF